MMDQFGWGAEFLRVNADVLETYAACADGSEVVRAQVRKRIRQKTALPLSNLL